MADWRNRIVGTDVKPASSFLANEANWRIHPAPQQAALLGSLSEVGWVTDVIVNLRSDPSWGADRGVETLIDGHLRVTLALREGDDTPIPVKMVDLLPSEESLILASFDPIATMAVADKEKLDALLRDVKPESAALQQMLSDLAAQEGLYTGNGAGTLEDTPEPKLDRAAELQQQWGTELGQLWVIDSLTVPGKSHRLLCGDSTKLDDIQQLMAGHLAQLVYTDPPYGVDYGGGTKVREKLAGDASTDLYVPCCKMAYTFSDDESALYLWHAGVKGIAAAAAAAAANYEIRCEIIWNKNQAQFGALSAQYKQKHEPAYYCFKRGKPPRWLGPTNEVTVWDVNRASVNEFHPTQKPVELAARAIQNSSENAHIVLDLFLGSGATMVASEQLVRICYGCDIEPKYIAVTLQRLADMGLQPRLLEP